MVDYAALIHPTNWNVKQRLRDSRARASSWPGLSRPSTFLMRYLSQHVDARDIGAKHSFVASPGHDDQFLLLTRLERRLLAGRHGFFRHRQQHRNHDVIARHRREVAD